MKLSLFKVGLRLLVLQLGLLLCQNLQATQPVFTVTPTAVSNTYIGPITLQISGVPTGDTVVIQKFGDVNADGVIDAGDQLVQQFNLTDGQAGMVIGGVTNINVPGDTDGSANGTITAKLNFPGGDFTQIIIGKYGFVLSSTINQFTPITNFFTVTNFPYAQTITGTVVSNGTSTVIPNASIILFPAPRPGHDLGSPVGATVANNSGAYSIQVPQGTYVPLAFKSNYVASYSAAPVLTLTNTQTLTTNLTMTVATASISGKIVDANNSSIVLPGLFVPANTKSGQILITSGSSDTNGNFTIPVTSGQWQLSGDPEGLAAHGYVAYDGGVNVNAPTNGFVGAFYKATSLFYGTVKDNLGNPLPGIAIEARDNNNNEFDNDGYSDANGNYVTGVVGSSNNDPWQVDVDHAPANYIFSQSAFQQNGTNMTVGKVVHQNFTGILATNHITGNVQFNGTNVVGVGVSAYATINGLNYNVDMVDTDTNGNYSLTVANSTNWTVNVYDCGCSDDDSLNNIIDGGSYQGNYLDPDSQSVNITNNDGTADFTVQFCGGVSIITTSPLPDATNGDYYDIQLQGSDCNNNFIWSLNDQADFPSSLTFNSDGEIFGTPDTDGTYNFSVHVDDGNGHTADQSLSLNITGSNSPLQINTTSLPEGTNGTFYSQTFQASGGTSPYSWAIADYSADPPPNLTLDTNGVLSGIPSATPSSQVGSYLFDVVVTDAAENSSTQTFGLYIVNPPLPPLIITNTSLPNGNVGVAYNAQLGATGGQSPYYWSYYPGSANLSLIGLSLDSNGLISGTPTTNRLFSFKVQVTDQNSAATNKVLSIILNPKPVLGSPSWVTNQFQMRLTGASNQNYTIQMSTNLSSTNWISLFITNSATTNSFNVIDRNATNKLRFYRTLIGP